MRILRFDEFAPSKQQREAFGCGAPSLDRWLVTQARQSMESRDAVTHLLIDGNGNGNEAVIAGYYCLAAGQVSRDEAPGAVRRGAPDPIPSVRMGRFAVDTQYHGQGWGAELLGDALLRAVSAGALVGARLMLVDAISDSARDFYLRFGFLPSPIHPLQVVQDLRVVAASAGLTPGGEGRR